MSALRIAVLGAGILGGRHARVFSEQDVAKVVAIVDPNPSRATVVAERAGADGNVLEIGHVRTAATLQVHEVEIAVQLEAKGSAHCDEILQTLRDKGYSVSLG